MLPAVKISTPTTAAINLRETIIFPTLPLPGISKAKHQQLEQQQQRNNNCEAQNFPRYVESENTTCVVGETQGKKIFFSFFSNIYPKTTRTTKQTTRI